MNGEKYFNAVMLTTQAAQKAGMSLPELLGVLELVKINVERAAYLANQDRRRLRIDPLQPPGQNHG